MLQFSRAEVHAVLFVLEPVPVFTCEPDKPQPMQNFSCVVTCWPFLISTMLITPVTALGGRPPPASTFCCCMPVKGLIVYARAVPRFALQVASGSLGWFVAKKIWPLT